MDNKIDPTAIVSPMAIIGDRNTIGAYTVIGPDVVIGDDNYIGPFVCIGEPGEYRNPPEDRKQGKIIIGSRNRISEFVSIQMPVLTGCTNIDDDCYIMDKCHIAHDCDVGNFVTMAPLTSLGGYVTICEYANIGQGVIVHPRRTIGEGAMIGMNATVTKDVPAWQTWIGTPARYMCENERGKKKYLKQ